MAFSSPLPMTSVLVDIREMDCSDRRISQGVMIRNCPLPSASIRLPISKTTRLRLNKCSEALGI